MIFNQSFKTRRLQSIFGSELVIRWSRGQADCGGGGGEGGSRGALVGPLGGLGTSWQVFGKQKHVLHGSRMHAMRLSRTRDSIPCGLKSGGKDSPPHGDCRRVSTFFQPAVAAPCLRHGRFWLQQRADEWPPAVENGPLATFTRLRTTKSLATQNPYRQ